MRVFTILLLILGVSASVSAATSGVVYGYITVNDSRANPYSNNDYAVDPAQKRHDPTQKFRQKTQTPDVFTSSVVPLKNTAVDVSVCSALNACIGTTVYTQILDILLGTGLHRISIAILFRSTCERKENQ
jgi:hypothetical protein